MAAAKIIDEDKDCREAACQRLRELLIERDQLIAVGNFEIQNVDQFDDEVKRIRGDLVNSAC